MNNNEINNVEINRVEKKKNNIIIVIVVGLVCFLIGFPIGLMFGMKDNKSDDNTKQTTTIVENPTEPTEKVTVSTTDLVSDPKNYNTEDDMIKYAIRMWNKGGEAIGAIEIIDIKLYDKLNKADYCEYTTSNGDVVSKDYSAQIQRGARVIYKVLDEKLFEEEIKTLTGNDEEVDGYYEADATYVITVDDGYYQVIDFYTGCGE